MGGTLASVLEANVKSSSHETLQLTGIPRSSRVATIFSEGQGESHDRMWEP